MKVNGGISEVKKLWPWSILRWVTTLRFVFFSVLLNSLITLKELYKTPNESFGAEFNVANFYEIQVWDTCTRFVVTDILPIPEAIQINKRLFLCCLFQTMQQAALTRWFVNGLIGVYVAVIAVVVALLIHNLSALKFKAVYACILLTDIRYRVWNRNKQDG